MRELKGNGYAEFWYRYTQLLPYSKNTYAGEQTVIKEDSIGHVHYSIITASGK